MPTTYLILDTETNGLPTDYRAPWQEVDSWPRVISFAWSLHDGAGRRIAAHEALVRPEGFVVTPGAVHGISHERAIEHGLPVADVLGPLSGVVRVCRPVLVGHNVAFDRSVVAAELHRLGSAEAFAALPTICTMRASTDYCRIPSKRPGKYKWPTLTELHVALFGEPPPTPHDAAQDVAATARSFFRLIELGAVSPPGAVSSPLAGEGGRAESGEGGLGARVEGAGAPISDRRAALASYLRSIGFEGDGDSMVFVEGTLLDGSAFDYVHMMFDGECVRFNVHTGPYGEWESLGPPLPTVEDLAEFVHALVDVPAKRREPEPLGPPPVSARKSERRPQPAQDNVARREREAGQGAIEDYLKSLGFVHLFEHLWNEYELRSGPLLEASGFDLVRVWFSGDQVVVKVYANNYGESGSIGPPLPDIHSFAKFLQSEGVPVPAAPPARSSAPSPSRGRSWLRSFLRRGG